MLTIKLLAAIILLVVIPAIMGILAVIIVSLFVMAFTSIAAVEKKVMEKHRRDYENQQH